MKPSKCYSRSSLKASIIDWCFKFFFQEKQEVIIEKVVRNKRKSITTVKGLELFGEI